MRSLFLLILFGTSQLQAAANYSQALGEFQKSFFSPGFSGSSISENNDLLLVPTNEYLQAGKSEQKIWVAEAFVTWHKALKSSGSNEPAEFLIIMRPGGGWIWGWNKGEVNELDQWSDERLHYHTPSRVGGVFGFFGGTYTFGSGVWSLNSRLGTTLFNNKYDAAITLGYSSATNFSIGLSGRALFAIKDNLGWNIGGQIAYSDASDFVLSALGGINYYLKSGSLDVTASLGTNSSWGLLLGYTFYFHQKQLIVSNIPFDLVAALSTCLVRMRKIQ